MMMKTTTIVAGVLLFSASALVGCAGETAHGEESAAPTNEAGDADSYDPTTSFSKEGLTLETSTADHVSGTFARDGATLRFDFARDGSARTMLLTGANGEKLVSSRLENGIDTCVFLDGKATVHGVANEEPVKEGDPQIFDLLNHSDARVMPQLKEALLAAKVSRSLITQEADAASGLHPEMVYNAYGYTFLEHYGEVSSFWSWSWWGTTTVVMGNGGTDMTYAAIDWNAWNYSRVNAKIQAGCCSSEYVDKYGFAVVARQWWGAQIWVTNLEPQIPALYAPDRYWQPGACRNYLGGTIQCDPGYWVYTGGWHLVSPAKDQKLVMYHY